MSEADEYIQQTELLEAFAVSISSNGGEVSPSKSPLMDLQNQLDKPTRSPLTEPMCSSNDAETTEEHATLASSSMPCSPIRQLPETDQQQLEVSSSSKNVPAAATSTLPNRFPFNIRETVDWIIGLVCFLVTAVFSKGAYVVETLAFYPR